MSKLFTRDEEQAWWNELRKHPGTKFYHLHTRPPENGIIIADMESLDMAVTYMSIASRETGVSILVYAVMSNHFHWLIRGTEEATCSFFERFRRILDTYLTRHGKGSVIRVIEMGLTEINSLKQFRDEVAYILRNPYVVRKDINVQSNLWTSSFLYYNPMLPMLKTTPFSKLSKADKRKLLSSSTLVLQDDTLICGSRVNPGSFVDYRAVEALFYNARKFTVWLLKNIEAQVEVSMRMGEEVNLPDEELSPLVWKFCKDRFNNTDSRTLTPNQIKDLIQEFKFNYHASNAQIARLTDVPLSMINAMFPPSQ
jgi:hypothetical protein